MKYVTAIVLAAGRGIRFKSKISKPLSKINSKPVIIYCLEALSRHPSIRDIIVVVNPLNKEKIINKIKQYKIGKIRKIVLGGKRRQDSVCRGLKAVDRRSELVLIHDGVRPFIDKETISSTIREAEKCGAAIAAVPVKATIKRVNKVQQLTVHSEKIVKETLNRKDLWEVQTPQVFKKELISAAYKKFGNTNVTDDASLVEKLGVPVKIVMGSCFNIKVTTPEDMLLAEAIVRKKSGG
jgi:2-C-methyl-D-erythritol 4-phosphate cytidylyltransferase